MKKLSIIMILVMTFAFIAVSCKGKDVNEETTATTATTEKVTETVISTEAQTEVVTQANDTLTETTTASLEEMFGDLDYNDQFAAPVEGEIVAIMTTSMGVIKMRLFEEVAPLAVENFTTHAKDGYYDGVTFHRVIQDFMIQGGDPTGTGSGGDSIYDSDFVDEFAVNYLPYRGALCMANSGANTNGSQFFIVQSDQVEDTFLTELEDSGFPEGVVNNYQTYGGAIWLLFKHTVFGQVYEGMDIVDSIAATTVDADSKPLTDVIIEKIEIQEY